MVRVLATASILIEPLSCLPNCYFIVATFLTVKQAFVLYGNIYEPNMASFILIASCIIKDYNALYKNEYKPTVFHYYLLFVNHIIENNNM